MFIKTVLKRFFLQSFIIKFKLWCLYKMWLCAKLGFKLHNSNQYQKTEEQNDLDKDILFLEIDYSVQWCDESESFIFEVQFQDRPFTKWGNLSSPALRLKTFLKSYDVSLMVLDNYRPNKLRSQTNIPMTQFRYYIWWKRNTKLIGPSLLVSTKLLS